MGRLIGPKTWDRSVRIFGSRFGQSRHCYGLLWTFCDNLFNKLCFGFMRPVMGKKFGSKKGNRDWTSGLPVDSPLLGFGTVKNSPGFV